MPSCSLLLISVECRSRSRFEGGFIGSPYKDQVGYLVEDNPPYSYTPIFHEMDTSTPKYEVRM